MARLRFQGVHSLDVADAYRRAVLSDARGAFNVAAEPVLDPAELGRLLGARPVSVSPRVLRTAMDVSWSCACNRRRPACWTWRSPSRSWI
jgi:UDP-glucose 4-epimerase